MPGLDQRALEALTQMLAALLLSVAVAVVLLGLDMLRRVRRARYRAEANEALDAEEAAARGENGDDPEPGDATPGR